MQRVRSREIKMSEVNKPLAGCVEVVEDIFVVIILAARSCILIKQVV